MKYRGLGRTDLTVSEIGLGCWQLGGDFGPLTESQAIEILNSAHQSGVGFLDTADVYGDGLSEERIGRWMSDLDDPPIVASKVGRHSDLYPNGYTREKVRNCLENSIRRLGVDYLDLAQLHCVPQRVLKSGDLIAWMEEFQRQGLIKHIGASVETIDEALFCCNCEAFSSLQIIFNLFRQDASQYLLPKAKENGIGIIVRLPLASGLLADSLRADTVFSETDHRRFNRNGEHFLIGETFNGIPYEQGLKLITQLRKLLPAQISMSQLALRWLLDHPQVSTVIVGVSKADQIAQNSVVSELSPLPEDLHQKLNSFYYALVREHIRGGI